MKNNSQKDLYITYVIKRRVIYNILILVCIYIFVSCVDTETYRLSVMNFEECKTENLIISLLLLFIRKME